ncbi:MAG: tRNA (adenosine(37)-N6)-dimethylallyltransferase MiaA [Clostridia bacterium]|nr:tRNA (adenosine(37)-N6)-dimethylallyltransferase MiaA [Clostridia bacterium]
MSDNSFKKCVVICGPTASGKTSLALKLTEAFNSVIISADSMQIYRGMDIGTAKPTEEEKRRVRHELTDICSPEEGFSAARYKELAASLIASYNADNVLPFLVGGTGLYIDSVIFNNDYADVPDSPKLREKLNAEYDLAGADAMLEKLKNIDPEAASKLHPADKKRIVRALEIFSLTGKTVTEFNLNSRTAKSDTDFLIFVLGYSDRSELYARIDKRVDLMMQAGLEKEAEELYKKGPENFPTASQAIGYKELFDHFKGECSLDEAVGLIKKRSRNYAKRQMTWFRKYLSLGAHFVEMSSPDREAFAEDILKTFVPDRFKK